ncbi:MAG: cytochrome c oxidase accessory protein CcoG [Xanthomonadales bacterium]|nr:cytochrome c oxidase accessory protein CcoG [Xanthomonadales bacterium]
MKQDSAPEKPGAGESLYRKEPKIYARQVKGTFARLRVIAVWVLLGLYYVLPWLNINGNQAVLFDLPARKFYILGLTFWPQDFVYLALLMITAGLSLFFFTALAGRLWCGFACPQTVWTETFMWIEQWVEGDRAKRMKLDKAPWTADKIMRKSAKQALWILFAAWTGFTFVGFFSPIRELGANIASLSLGPWETFWIVFYSFATYGNAGFLREQVCKYMCPYARFQSAMFDKDTLIISYDPERGEPRGGRRKKDNPAEKGLGDCINCTLCVQVCPTGIDIRNGLQYECIACAACIDVCDQVMDKMEYPRGLIRYTTEHSLKHKTKHVIRPRIIIYGVLLIAILGGTIWSMTHRVPLRADLIRDRNALYRELPGNLVENVYTLKITNMDNAPHRYDMRVLNNDAVEIDMDKPLSLQAEEVLGVSVRLRIPRSAGQGVQTLDIEFQSQDDPSIRIETTAKALMPMDFGN